MTKTHDFIANACYTLSQTGKNWISKLLGASFFAALVNFFHGLNTEGIIIAFILVIVDCITGIYASVHTGDKIRSAKLTVTAEKIFIYGIMMLSGFLIDKQLGVHFAQSATVFFVGATQFVSILENIGRAGLPVPKDIIKRLSIYTGKKNGEQ